MTIGQGLERCPVSGLATLRAMPGVQDEGHFVLPVQGFAAAGSDLTVEDGQR
jgi:hypothetical protein